MDGLCHCGCGERTPISRYTNRSQGRVRGQPLRYIAGHHRRKSPVDYIEEDRGYITPCWVWQRSLDNHGYARRGTMGSGRVQSSFKIHRENYEKKYGPIPDELDLDHLCRVRSCVNPDHMEPVTRLVNIERGRGAKLRFSDVEFIRRHRETSAKELAHKFGVTRTSIYAIRNNVTWKGVGDAQRKCPDRDALSKKHQR